MKFTVPVKLPSNFIGSGVTVQAYFKSANSNVVFAKSNVISASDALLTVAKPTGQSDTQATSLVSFGVDPAAATEIAKGVGIYSTPFCLAASATNGLGTNYISNCGVSTVIDHAKAASDGAKVLDLVNTIEITWALPYEIPNDRTMAEIVCKTE